VSSWSIWSERLGRPGERPPDAEMRLLLKLIVFVIALALIMMPILASGQATDAPNFSAESDSVVVLSNSEADSLLDLIDDQALHVRLLEADLWEARELARSDSVLASEQLKLQEHYYEQIIQAYRDDQDTWVERIVKQPLIWFGLGVWLAGQAQ